MLRRYLSAGQVGINAVTASVALSAAPAIPVKNAKRLTAVFKRAAHSSGSGLYEIYGTIDGTNYFALPFTRVIANTNAQGLTRDISVSLASNTSVMVIVEELFMNVSHIKFQYTETTDGTATIDAMIEDELMS